MATGTGPGEPLKRLRDKQGHGCRQGFWHLAQALLALCPGGPDEIHWVDGVLACKK